MNIILLLRRRIIALIRKPNIYLRSLNNLSANLFDDLTEMSLNTTLALSWY